MVKESKEQPGERPEESQYVEIPDDRLEQLEQPEAGTPQIEPEEKPVRKSPARRKPKQALVPEEAAKKETQEPDISKEDLLADIRQALVAADEEAPEPKGFFGRIRNKLKKTPEPPEKKAETQALSDDLLETQADLQPSLVEARQKKKEPTSNKAEEKAIQEFFADLEALADIEVEEYVPPVPEPRGEVAPQVQEDELAPVPKLPVKTRPEEAVVDFDAIREAALQEYDETKIEVEERKPQLREEVRQTIRESKPFERFLLIGAGVVTVLILLFSGVYLIANSISVPTPTPVPTVDVANIVHPTQLTLPGGWEFRLGQGQVVEGEWNPQRAEWLVETEISRWVALPWSLQLEAVLRTLKPEDQLELTMSNADVLVFNVYSIQELSMEQLLASDPMTPSLLVVLYNEAEPDGTYWVVEARP